MVITLKELFDFDVRPMEKERAWLSKLNIKDGVDTLQGLDFSSVNSTSSRALPRLSCLLLLCLAFVLNRCLPLKRATMQFSQRLTALVVALDFVSSAGGMSHPQPRNFDANKHVDLGLMNSLDDFYEYVGTTHEDWEDIDQGPVSVASRSYKESTTSASDVSLSVFADEQCGERTTSDGQVCQQTPNYTPYFIAAAAVAVPGLIVFSGDIADRFMQGWASFHMNGGWSTNRRAIIHAASGSLRQRRDEWEDKLVRFTVPRSIEVGVVARSVDDDGVVTEAASFGHYAYNSKSGVLSHESEVHRLTQDDSELRRRRARGLTTRQEDAYSLEVEDYRISNAVTIATEACLADLIGRYVQRTIDNGRASCQPAADGASPWINIVGIYVNPGADQWDRVVECCP